MIIAIWIIAICEVIRIAQNMIQLLAIKRDAKNKDNVYAEFIKSLPSVQPEPKWIPCSEQLPDKPNVYTVTDHNGRVVRYVYNDNESSREYWKRCAKAWMPLPEPYKERREE